MPTWTADDVLSRGAKAFEKMAPMLRLWQAAAELFYPERADFTLQNSPGEERYFDIFDEEGVLLRRNLSNQIGAMIRPRGRDWFMCKAYPRHLNDNDDVRMWCEDATKVMREVVYSSRANFSRTFSESDNDYVTFGTSVVAHTYSHDRTGLLFRCLHPRDCAWNEHADGSMDFYERMMLSLSKLDEMGMIIPKELIAAYTKDAHQEVEVWRCTYPVARYGGDANMPRSAKFAVTYVAVGVKKELKPKSGQPTFFRTWPYLVRRWQSVSGEPAGRSPCTGVAMATGRMLNQTGLAIIESLEKLVNPPLLAPDDGIAGEIQIRANGITYYDAQLDYGSRSPIESLEVGRPDFGMAFAEEKRGFLARAFLQNLITFPPADKSRTAYETDKLYQQYLRDAAPVFEPMEAENGELMEGVFERVYDADGPGKTGGFAEPPEELMGAEIKFEFETPLSSAYRRMKFEQAVEVNQYIATRVQANPGILDLVDQDEMDREAFQAIIPQGWIRKQDEVEEIREEKQKQQMLQMAANMAIQSAHAQTGGTGDAPQLTPPHDPLAAAA
jgi:hypothetical protein